MSRMRPDGSPLSLQLKGIPQKVAEVAEKLFGNGALFASRYPVISDSGDSQKLQPVESGKKALVEKTLNK